jgi:hypothetical protein
VAKTRGKTRKPGASSTRAKGTRKSAGKRKVSPKRAKPQGPAVLDLKRLRREIDMAVSALSRRVAMRAQPSADLDEAQTMLTRWASEIDNNLCADEGDGPCGPTMLIPLS